MLHLIQKLDRGRWKTVAIATDSGAAQDRLDRAVGATPTARFRLVAMVDGGEKLVRQVEPRLRDLLPMDPPSVLRPPNSSDRVSQISHPPVTTAPMMRAGDDPFIPPPAQIVTQFSPPTPTRLQSLNPLRLALQLGGAMVVVLVLVDNVAAVSDRMRVNDIGVSAPAPNTAWVSTPIPLDPPPVASDVASVPPATAPLPDVPVPVLEIPTAPEAPIPVAAAAEPMPIMQTLPPPVLVSSDDCRGLAQARARFASRIDPMGLVQTDAHHAEGADLQFRTLTGGWRSVQYRCQPAPGGGLMLSDIRLRSD